MVKVVPCPSVTKTGKRTVKISGDKKTKNDLLVSGSDIVRAELSKTAAQVLELPPICLKNISTKLLSVPSVLIFKHSQDGLSLQALLSIKNNSTRIVGFQVTPSSSEKYVTQPRMGYLKPKEEKFIEVSKLLESNFISFYSSGILVEGIKLNYDKTVQAESKFTLKSLWNHRDAFNRKRTEEYYVSHLVLYSLPPTFPPSSIMLSAESVLSPPPPTGDSNANFVCDYVSEVFDRNDPRFYVRDLQSFKDVLSHSETKWREVSGCLREEINKEENDFYWNHILNGKLILLLLLLILLFTTPLKLALKICGGELEKN